MLVLKFNYSLAVKNVIITFFILAMAGGVGVAREIYVHAGSQAGTADGSQALPFKTISDALNVVKAGDTVIVREGIYRESVRVPGGEPGKPVSLRAADGERVVLSGAVPITGWKKHVENVYVTVLDFRPERLLAASRSQPIAREPNEGWWTAAAVDDLTITDSKGLKTLSNEYVEGQAYIWATTGNVFFTVPLASLDRANGRFTVVRESKWMRLGAGDRYYLKNHLSLIDSPGEWAVQEEGGKFRIYFQPEESAHLSVVETPRQKRSILSVYSTKHVRISGLEIAASAHNGIEVMKSEDVVISNCILHNHGYIGALLRDVNNVTVRHNIFLYNSYGLGLHTVSNSVIEENEIAYNTTDGIIVSYNSTDVDVRRNYIHHHLLWGHPDGIQIYIGVKNVRFIDNLLIASGQSIMMGDTSDGLLKGNMLIGSAAYSTIFGADNYRILNNTIAFSGYGSMNLRGNNYEVRENIFVTGDESCIFPVRGVEGYVGDRNLLYNAPRLAKKVVVVSDKGWHTSFAEYRRATGFDRNSVYGDPKFRNAPAIFAVLDFKRIADCSRSMLYLGSSSRRFNVGDTVEVDFDGVSRKVTARNNATITVSPELRAKPMTPSLVCNWGRSNDISLDLRLADDSPGAKLSASGGPVGSMIDIAAYRRGDFNADGQCDLPSIPTELEPKHDR